MRWRGDVMLSLASYPLSFARERLTAVHRSINRIGNSECGLLAGAANAAILLGTRAHHPICLGRVPSPPNRSLRLEGTEATLLSYYYYLPGRHGR